MSEIDFEQLKRDETRLGIKSPKKARQQKNVEDLAGKGHYGYHCRKCGEFFQHLWELSAHHNKVHRRRVRRLGSDGLQFSVPSKIPKDWKILKVRRIKNSTQITSTYFISPDLQYVKVHKPVAVEGGVWVFFKPLLNLGSDKPDTKNVI